MGSRLPAGRWAIRGAAWANWTPHAAALPSRFTSQHTSGNVWTLVTGLTDLALVLRAQDDLHGARTLLEEALQTAEEQGARSLGYIARMETALAGVLSTQGELVAAEQLLAAAFAHVGRWPNRIISFLPI